MQNVKLNCRIIMDRVCHTHLLPREKLEASLSRPYKSARSLCHHISSSGRAEVLGRGRITTYSACNQYPAAPAMALTHCCPSKSDRLNGNNAIDGELVLRLTPVIDGFLLGKTIRHEFVIHGFGQIGDAKKGGDPAGIDELGQHHRDGSGVCSRRQCLRRDHPPGGTDGSVGHHLTMWMRPDSPPNPISYKVPLSPKTWSTDEGLRSATVCAMVFRTGSGKSFADRSISPDVMRPSAEMCRLTFRPSSDWPLRTYSKPPSSCWVDDRLPKARAQPRTDARTDCSEPAPSSRRSGRALANRCRQAAQQLARVLGIGAPTHHAAGPVVPIGVYTLSSEFKAVFFQKYCHIALELAGRRA